MRFCLHVEPAKQRARPKCWYLLRFVHDHPLQTSVLTDYMTSLLGYQCKVSRETSPLLAKRLHRQLNRVARSVLDSLVLLFLTGAISATRINHYSISYFFISIVQPTDYIYNIFVVAGLTWVTCLTNWSTFGTFTAHRSLGIERLDQAVHSVPPRRSRYCSLGLSLRVGIY